LAMLLPLPLAVENINHTQNQGEEPADLRYLQAVPQDATQ